MNFSKMHSLSNDFVIINNINSTINITSKIVRRLSNRRTGIGFDQFLIIEKPIDLYCDFYYRIFNADGYEVNQCGNGARCFAYFIFLKKLTNKKNIHIATKQKYMTISNINTNKILVNIGIPVFIPKEIPCLVSGYRKIYSIIINDRRIQFSIVSVGNPHCIIQVENINNIPINTLGPIIERHALFPEKTNVGFMEIVTKNKINLRVYERGVGETKACGSGACAAVAVGINLKLLNKDVQVDLLGGSLKISWAGNKSSMYMEGPATYVYDGFIYI
ncbi:diaminopimelate epimerase [Buchnera aphidicola (Hormaphis cornu)]|nr:diaminopimelate epimerase [Buchnera aphidicola (Hormaphis cornu)]